MTADRKWTWTSQQLVNAVRISSPGCYCGFNKDPDCECWENDALEERIRELVLKGLASERSEPLR